MRPLSEIISEKEWVTANLKKGGLMVCWWTGYNNSVSRALVPYRFFNNYAWCNWLGWMECI